MPNLIDRELIKDYDLFTEVVCGESGLVLGVASLVLIKLGTCSKYRFLFRGRIISFTTFLVMR